MTITLDPFVPDTWNETERDYFRRVDQAVEQRANLLFSNGLPEHAVYLIEKFFMNAKEEVRLFSGRLSRAIGGVEVYGNRRISSAVEKMMAAGVSLHVVLQDAIDVDTNETWIDHPLVRVHRGMGKEKLGSLEIRQASAAAIEHLRQFKFLNHWMVMDRTAYRLETDVRRAAAHVNFGDSEMAGVLADIFDDVLFKSARPLT